jgi:hypothetical protein
MLARAGGIRCASDPARFFPEGHADPRRSPQTAPTLPHAHPLAGSRVRQANPPRQPPERKRPSAAPARTHPVSRRPARAALANSASHPPSAPGGAR